MKKQKWLLFNLGAYLVGIATCLLIKNFSVLFVLMVIPTFFVFLRGAMNENKWNKSGVPEVAFVKRNIGTYLFDNRLYTFALLKKKLRDYGCLEVKEILPKGRINA